jgi:hypothetical protein
MRLDDSASGGWLIKTLGCGGAIVLLLYLVGGWLGRALGPLKVAGRSVQCQSNLRVLLRAEAMYAADYQDRLPPASQWLDRIDFFLDENQEPAQVRCPEVGKPGQSVFGYAMNAELSAKERSQVQDFDIKPLLFDSPDLAWSAVSQGLILPSPGRHIGNERKGQKMTRGNYVGLGGGGVRFRADASP